MRDEQTAIYTTGGGEGPFHKYLSGVDGLKIVMKSSSNGSSGEKIPSTSCFQQEEYIPYLQLEQEGGFDNRNSNQKVPSDQLPSQLIIPLRFHDEGLKNFTFMLRRISSVKQFLVSSFLAPNVESLFGNLEKKNEIVRKIMNAPLDIRAHVYPDTTFSMCLKMALDSYIIQHELRLPTVIDNSPSSLSAAVPRGWINETLLSIKSNRAHTDIFQSFSPIQSQTLLSGLFRAYQTKNIAVDVGGCILACDYMPGNLAYAARFGIVSPLSQKKTTVVFNGDLLGHMHLSYTTQISRIYGLAASAQLRYNSTQTQTEMAVGIECVSPPGAEDYATKFRVDTEKGIAALIEKRKFWNNDKLNVGVTIAKNFSGASSLSGLKLGLNLQIEY
ncbi:hypothetical protein NAEGRDRAFT_77782 [Naegleria gruberi]|uniref:Uncharacterized protein n=1 Tax=Naegleria gruberi TaxID=5762 RepID=D2UYD7_NAEGR|nr:uncharacterized protein NAEGRDRAFT_77782 [Naegleria gruberi]EFC50457.1 hypothetical protein NAEGRDRAFT_77782 [Naegleria gruberi]|eukprot:XP_002683201.1 hypothetical protein NAEGRDRAFT_77782 [Naegleria gruberi strain NEG-M]